MLAHTEAFPLVPRVGDETQWQVTCTGLVPATFIHEPT